LFFCLCFFYPPCLVWYNSSMLEIIKMYLVFMYKSHLNIESDNFMNHVNKGCFPLFICLKSIPTDAQYVTLDNKIKCMSLAVVFFCNPTNKSVTGTANTWELLLANHLDQSLWSTNQKYWPAVRSNLLHSFFEGAQLCCAFYQPRQAALIWCRKTNFLS
jgi:hypothetical protein